MSWSGAPLLSSGEPSRVPGQVQGEQGPRLKACPFTARSLGPAGVGGAPTPGDSRPQRQLTGWKTGGCRMKVSGSGSSFSPGDMGVERLQLDLLIQIPGALPPLTCLPQPGSQVPGPLSQLLVSPAPSRAPVPPAAGLGGRSGQRSSPGPHPSSRPAGWIGAGAEIRVQEQEA